MKEIEYLMKELDDLIAVLESKIPGNPESPENVKLADALEKDLKKYFSKLESVLPTGEIERIYTQYVGG